jgi:uracil-DNA glycosylase
MKPILLLGESKGQHEARIGSSFVGASGIELLLQLHEAEIIDLSQSDRVRIRQFYTRSDPHLINEVWQGHPQVFRTNVFQLHPPGDELAHFCGPKVTALPSYPKLGTVGWVQAKYATELQRLGDEILATDPNLVVALGNAAIWSLAGKTGISKLRGTTLTSTHTVSGFKLLGTYHPAAVLRQWQLRPTVIMDLMKAKREAAFPEVRRPRRLIWIEPTIEDIERFYNEHVVGCRVLSVDIETAGQLITSVGLAPSREAGLVIPFYDGRAKTRSYWRSPADEVRAWQIVKRVLEDRTIRKVFQNGLYDIAFLWRANHIRVLGAEHDTMLLHHALHPESLKGLGYLGSLYADEGPWKTERGGTATIKRDE